MSCFSRFFNWLYCRHLWIKAYPFYLGIIFPIVGFLISLLLVKDTKEFTKLEIKKYKKDEKRDD